MYASENFKTKKAFKDAVKSGAKITLYAPGLGTVQKVKVKKYRAIGFDARTLGYLHAGNIIIARKNAHIRWGVLLAYVDNA